MTDNKPRTFGKKAPYPTAGRHRDAIVTVLRSGADLARIWTGGCFVFVGFCLVAGLLALSGGGLWIWLVAPIPFVLAYVLLSPSRDWSLASRWPNEPPAAPFVMRATPLADAEYDYDRDALIGQAARFGLPGGLLIAAALALPLFRVPLMAAGMAGVLVALLILLRLAGNPVALKFDAEGIWLSTLLGEERLGWSEVRNAYIHKFFPLDLATLFAIGTTLALVVETRERRQDLAARLLIPLSLLKLTPEQRSTLVASMAGLGEADTVQA